MEYKIDVDKSVIKKYDERKSLENAEFDFDAIFRPFRKKSKFTVKKDKRFKKNLVDEAVNLL